MAMPGNNTAGPKYTSWGELETWLKHSDMTEVDFTVEFGLGFYALREWKRRDRVPSWAVTALSRSSRIRQAGVLNIENNDVEETLAKTFLNPDKWEEWLAVNARRAALLAEALNAKNQDEDLAAGTRQKLQLAAFPEFDPKNPPDL